MSNLVKEMVFLILQFLDEEKYKETIHTLERESGYFFNFKYFEEKVLLGEWDEVEKYLSGFTKFDDNRFSMKIFFEIRKQKYLEALDRPDRAKALEIINQDLKVFAPFNEELYKELLLLLTLNNFRENEQLSNYNDIKSARVKVLGDMRKLMEVNPLLSDKLAIPNIKAQRLRSLINQSLNWQHHTCKTPMPNPVVETLLTDHLCLPQNEARAPTPVLPVAAVAKPSTYAPLGVHGGPFQPTPAPNANVLAGCMANPNPNPNPSSSVPCGVVAESPFPMQPHQVAMLKHPRQPSNSLRMREFQCAEHEQLMKRLRRGPADNEAQSRPAADLPINVMSTIPQGSVVTSMDFHPFHHTLLAVGCSNGEVTLWEVGSREKIVTEPFKTWNMAACSVIFQDSIVKDPSISVSRLSWSPDGKWIGVAFSKHMIHVYAYQGSELLQHLEMDAHVGCVNDLAFAHPKKQLCVVTCGDDKLIKVWELSGEKLYTFEGHEAPVYSIYPHQKEDTSFLFSTDLNGKIKAWLYDNLGPRVNYDAPGQWCTTLLYSADGSRLFSCGTSKDGDSFLVEWNDTEGAIKRKYMGCTKKSTGGVQFDTTHNRYLAVGEDNQVKFWDMDCTNLLTIVDADGGLPSLPRLRFNKEGNLLAVTTADKGFKILANGDGQRILRSMESRFFEASRASAEMKVKINPMGNQVSSSAMVTSSVPAIGKMDQMDNGCPTKTGNDAMTRCMERVINVNSELMEIVDHAQCRQLTMQDSNDSISKVCRLLYTNSGNAILALGTNGVQRQWRWSRSEQNPTGKATTSVTPQLWRPKNGLLMTNDVPENPEETVPCIALSMNDSYVMSACGGKVSLFNRITFKVMATFMTPPPASTFLLFYPQDCNIAAIGMEDSTINIYNIRVDELKAKLKGHKKHITGLAFSTTLNILVSSGADAQLCFWSTDSWEKKKSSAIQPPAGKSPVGDTLIQFHNDQVHLLVSHETQIAIYDCSKMECIQKWEPQESISSPITSASYSCNSQLVYASFADGNIGVFDAEYLRLRCRIAPSAYMPQPRPNSAPVMPLVITANPQELNQIAVGLSDGSIKVLEPREPLRRWGVAEKAGTENGRPSSAPATNSSGSDQPKR